MKKTLLASVIIATMSYNSIAQAAESSFMDKLKEYGLPCAVSLLAGFALADKTQNGTAIGVAACGAVSMKTFLDNRKEAPKMELSKEEQDFMQKMIESSTIKIAEQKDKERDLKFEEKVKEVKESQKNQIEELRNVLREVLADRMIKMEEDMKHSLQKQLESGDLMPKLESNLKDMIKKEVISESKSRQKEIVEKCVELTIKEVIAKPVGVQENQTGLQEDK